MKFQKDIDKKRRVVSYNIVEFEDHEDFLKIDKLIRKKFNKFLKDTYKRNKKFVKLVERLDGIYSEIRIYKIFDSEILLRWDDWYGIDLTVRRKEDEPVLETLIQFLEKFDIK